MRVMLLSSSPPRMYAVVMGQGEEIASGLEAFARETAVDAAAFTAIGAVSEATLGFFDPDIADYREIPLNEQAEIASLIGDVTRPGDAAPGSRARTVHAHMVLARADGSTVGGHLIEASVRPTLEVVVTETPAALRRRYDPRTGLALIDLERSEGMDGPQAEGRAARPTSGHSTS